MSDSKITGLKEFQAAIRRNPRVVVVETQKYFQKGMAAYRKTIQNDPWTLGEGGGGSPVDTGELRGSHRVEYKEFEASIAPNRNRRSPYANFVHGGTKRMKARAWLDYAKRKNKPNLKRLYQEMLKNIVTNLAK